MVLQALQNWTRRRLIEDPRMQPQSVAETHGMPTPDSPSDVPLHFPFRGPAVSRGMQSLLQAKLVKGRHERKRHYFQLDQPGFGELRFYQERLESLPGFRS